MKGSRPFCVNESQDLGRAKRSETEPCERPKIFSPNCRWLIELMLRYSEVDQSMMTYNRCLLTFDLFDQIVGVQLAVLFD